MDDDIFEFADSKLSGHIRTRVDGALVICNNTKDNFSWEPEKINVEFHKNCENIGKF